MVRTISQLAVTSEEEADRSQSYILLRYITRSHQCMHFLIVNTLILRQEETHNAIGDMVIC